MELLVPNTVTMASAKALQINKVQLPPRWGRKSQHAWKVTAAKGPARKGHGPNRLADWQAGTGDAQASAPRQCAWPARLSAWAAAYLYTMTGFCLVSTHMAPGCMMQASTSRPTR